jgi:hypothetical protein
MVRRRGVPDKSWHPEIATQNGISDALAGIPRMIENYTHVHGFILCLYKNN